MIGSFYLQQDDKKKVNESKIMGNKTKYSTYDQVIDYIKETIKNEGLGSLLALAVKLKSIDIERTHKINKNMLQSILPFMKP